MASTVLFKPLINRLLGNLQYLLLSFFCIDETVTGKFFDYRGQFSWLFSFFTEFTQLLFHENPSLEQSSVVILTTSLVIFLVKTIF